MPDVIFELSNRIISLGLEIRSRFENLELNSQGKDVITDMLRKYEMEALRAAVSPDTALESELRQMVDDLEGLEAAHQRAVEWAKGAVWLSELLQNRQAAPLFAFVKAAHEFAQA